MAECAMLWSLFSKYLTSGVHQFILRYQEDEGETPCYAGFKMILNGQTTYSTRASDWKGQANSIGAIEWI